MIDRFRPGIGPCRPSEMRGLKAVARFRRRLTGAAIAGLLSALLLSPALAQEHLHDGASPAAPSEAALPAEQAAATATSPSGHQISTIFTLKTGIADGRMVYIGVGGDIEGKINPHPHGP
jgi:nitrite reductase (NO-forming)